MSLQNFTSMDDKLTHITVMKINTNLLFSILYHESIARYKWFQVRLLYLHIILPTKHELSI